jgi:Rod binding domain-containing protein
MSTMAPAAAAGSTAATEAYGKRVARAAHQFEAVLLNSLLGSLEHSFSALPGKKSDSAADDYHSMGMQALSATLAASGGVGIASMIIRNLMRAKGQSQKNLAGLPKVT